jgi:hypothetical protein
MGLRIRSLSRIRLRCITELGEAVGEPQPCGADAEFSTGNRP